MLQNTGQNIYLIVLWVSLSITFLVLMNYFWPPARRRIHNDVIGWQISILGTIYAVMIGFMLYAVWANFQTAETNADNEADALVNLFRSANGLPSTQRSTIEIASVGYVNAVLDREWHTMDQSQTPVAGTPFIRQLWETVTVTPTSTDTQLASLHQAMHELSELTQHRRVRVLESRTRMPTILWTVLVIGGCITIAACCLIGSENVTLHFCLILALSLLISMSLVAIGDIDSPFQGVVHVSPYAFVRARSAMLDPNEY